MILFPAIDIVDGKAVRLFKGDYQQMTVYSDNPAEIALDFKNCGATAIHIVDLEGAKDGTTPNFDTVLAIKKASGLFCEIGGGIRNEEIVVDYAQVGALRVIIGTKAITDPEFTRRMIKKHGSNVAVGIDIVGTKVAINGWTKVTDTTVDELIEALIDDGVNAIICTDIARDGAMKGTNLELYRKLVSNYGGYIDIMASGGISTMDDLRALNEIGVYGSVVGRALYNGALDLRKVLDEFSE